MEETFSLSEDMTKDVGSNLKVEKLFGAQDFLMETWTVIGESELMRLLRNAYKRIKTKQEQFNISISSLAVFSTFLT